ncbi:MAG: prepilin-type N-terminal cleavage/methylation domain-containing protein [Candidatus Thiodiazotropha sp. (ex Lucinoma kastoroae)]|nr:prepilin-type N-terminal cleavage/methylation domain-containing protein [Candidatus Thiodiazotropha sp. (ex Lucinoma kastoroae)]MCU7859318.1 prepilin-type N-terminal cleavage/methylation domain-containing protein [Candidatus Thiodiazotropha sp. (ex Lucinoma kastoroae)]
MQIDRKAVASMQSGFSLLEVLVAFTVLAISLGVVMQALSSNTRGLSIAAQHADAATIAGSKLAEVGTVYPLEVSRFEGDSGDTFRWRLTIETNPHETGYLKEASFLISVIVTWGEGRSSKQYVLSTLRNR